MGAMAVVTFDHTLSEEQLHSLAMEFAEHVKPTIPGLVWKIFVKHGPNRSGGIYFFRDVQHAERYASGAFMAGMREAPGIQNVSVEVFAVMDAPSLEAAAPLPAAG